MGAEPYHKWTYKPYKIGHARLIEGHMNTVGKYEGNHNRKKAIEPIRKLCKMIQEKYGYEPTTHELQKRTYMNLLNTNYHKKSTAINPLNTKYYRTYMNLLHSQKATKKDGRIC